MGRARAIGALDEFAFCERVFVQSSRSQRGRRASNRGAVGTLLATVRRGGIPMPGHRDLFTIGSSLGGVEALRRLLPQLPSDFEGTLLVAQHTASDGRLDDVLRVDSKLPVQYVIDG